MQNTVIGIYAFPQRSYMGKAELKSHQLKLSIWYQLTSDRSGLQSGNALDPY
jgi:hypothetical protein